jgi:hypothetical protein
MKYLRPTDWVKDESWKKRKGFVSTATWEELQEECDASLRIIRPGKKRMSE